MTSRRTAAFAGLRGWARALPAALLLVLVLFGLLEIHPAYECVSESQVANGGVYYPAAAHPHSPIHIEEARAARRPMHPVCLHLLQTNGTLPRIAGLELPLSKPAAACDAFLSLTKISARSSGVRGPPSFS
jgi:hypothetical protein